MLKFERAAFRLLSCRFRKSTNQRFKLQQIKRDSLTVFMEWLT